MRICLLAICFALLLVGCASVPTVPTPIPSPVAISTPVPTAVPVPTTSTGLLSYKAAVTPVVSDYGGALNRMTTAIPANGVFDAVSRARFSAALGTFSGALTDIRIALGMMTAPRQAQAFHSCFTESVDMMANSTLKLQTGTATGDAQSLGDGQRILVAAGTRWTECGKLFISDLQ